MFQFLFLLLLCFVPCSLIVCSQNSHDLFLVFKISCSSFCSSCSCGLFHFKKKINFVYILVRLLIMILSMEIFVSLRLVLFILMTCLTIPKLLFLVFQPFVQRLVVICSFSASIFGPTLQCDVCSIKSFILFPVQMLFVPQTLFFCLQLFLPGSGVVIIFVLV